MIKSHVIRLDVNDNVVVARLDLLAGTAIEDEGFVLLTDVPSGYKCSSRNIKKGEEIRKYNTVIGFAAEDIEVGTMMHNHNIRFDNLDFTYEYGKDYKPIDYIKDNQRRTFMGIHRPDGRVATRNYIGIIVCSNCAATVARRIANHFNDSIMKQYSNVDGVVPFITELGCGMEQSGEPIDLLRRTIAGYIRNPNIGAAIVVAIGCERNNIDMLFEEENLKTSDLLHKIVIQDAGGTKKSIDLGIKLVNEMLTKVNNIKREICSVEHLTVALECGGSDGLSGLSANPALGKAMDILVLNGGTCILSETTEIFGAQHILTRRAISEEIGKKLIDRIDWWIEHTKGRDNQINGKVSPGNNKGGITNVLEKSLGGVKKSGSTPLMDVIEYAHPVKTKGLIFMDSPGYDPIASTGQFASGANIMCFTTGRGSCYGSVIAPVIKISSNTLLYEKMEDDMDINCGEIIDGNKNIEEMGKEIFEMILRVASNEKTKSEKLGIGEDEFAPWPIGVYA